MKKIILSFTLSSFIIFNWNCETDIPVAQSRVVIGVPADAETLNPLFAVSLTEGQINELLFLGLVKHDWDENAADITSSPLLAESWEWNKDSTSVTFFLRENSFWSDGIKLTSEDILFSFDLYSDPEVNSKFFGSYDNLFTEKNQHINLKKSFEIISPTKIRINFKPGSKPSLFDIDMPILPKHAFSKIPRKDLSTEAIADLKKNDQIIIVARTGRDYDYIGWNNIDPELYSKSKTINPNKFFGSSNVRKALSYAINSEEILKEYLQGFGQLSFGPVSPIFKNYYNPKLKSYEYSPSKAKEILASEGWLDRNQNGIIEKNNLEFSFKLFIGSGNARRTYAATVVKNDLKAVGIDVTIETMEMSAFINKLFEHELDAFMAGWTIPLPIDLQPFWHSDFNRSPFNLSGFSNTEVDKILNALEVEKSREKKVILYKKIQELLHENEPVTFLYWLDVKTAFNSRIENITINPLGAIQQCWNWRIKK